MATAKRIYVVHIAHGGENGTETRLVRAPNPAQAIRHVADQTITADVATQDDLVDLINAGIKVETAGKDSAPDDDDEEKHVHQVGQAPEPETSPTTHP